MRNLLTGISVLLLLTACSTRTDNTEKPVLMVSVPPQEYLLKNLAGNEYTVSVMLDRGADPETFDPTLDKRMSAEKADAYFSTGVFPFEKKLQESAPAGKTFVNTSEGIEYIFGTHSHTHGGEAHHDVAEADPHVWTSVANARIMAANMASALERLNPDSASVYRRRLGQLNARFDSIDASIRSRLAGSDSVFAIWHPSLSYFARDYGLHQLAVGQESKEMPAKRVRQVIDAARQAGVRVFFFQREYDNRQADGINDGIGSRLVTIDPLASDWEGQMDIISDALSRP